MTTVREAREAVTDCFATWHQCILSILGTDKASAEVEELKALELRVLDTYRAALLAAVRATVEGMPAVRYTDVCGNYIHTVVNRDDLLAALDTIPEDA